MHTAKYFISIITSEQQLNDALHFRYQVYKNTFPKAIEKFTAPYECDVYDPSSIHLGLYCGDDLKLIGYARMVLPPKFEDQFSPWLIKRHAMYEKNIRHSNGYPKLPLIGYLPDEIAQAKVNAYCSDLECSNNAYIEVSRLIIKEEFRSVALSTFFVAGIIAVFNAWHISFAMFSCNPHHERFYQQFGLNRFDNIPAFYHNVWGDRIIIYGMKLNFTESFKYSIADLEKEFENVHRINFTKISRQTA